MNADSRSPRGRPFGWETALITGGSTGIGAALARKLVAGGTRVAVCGRRSEPIQALIAELGDRLVGITGDVAHPESARAMVAEAASRLGAPLDLVVANAGMGGNKPGRDLRVEHIVGILQLNVVGACATLAAAIPDMVARKRGHLVGISSLAGMRGLPTSAAYSASKAALSVFLESLRVDLRSSGIQVTDVRPGFIDTPLTKKNRFPMPFLMTADEAAARIVRAMSRGTGVYAFPWPTALAMRFLSVVPDSIYDRFAGRARIDSTP